MSFKTTLITMAALMASLILAAGTPANTMGVDATRLKQLSTDKSPLDVETSTDGKLMFVLVPGEVLIFSDLGDRPISRIAVDKHFDRITFAEQLDLLILSGKKNKKVEMVRIDLINDISIEGSPYRGRVDAPVTIAVFDDYQ